MTTLVGSCSTLLEEAVIAAFNGCSEGVFRDPRQRGLLVMWRGEQRALWPIRINGDASASLVSIEVAMLTVQRHRRGAVGLLLGQLNEDPLAPKLSMVDGIVRVRDAIDLKHVSDRAACLQHRFEEFCFMVDALYPTVAACAHPDRQDAHLILQGEFWQPATPITEMANDSLCNTRTPEG